MTYNKNLMAEWQEKIGDKINCKDCTEDDFDDKMAVSFVAMDNNPPPVFDSGKDCTEDDIDENLATSSLAMDKDYPPVFDSDPENE